jgi:hypothetical protein
MMGGRPRPVELVVPNIVRVLGVILKMHTCHLVATRIVLEDED